MRARSLGSAIVVVAAGLLLWAGAGMTAASGLTPGERKALRIVSVNARAAEPAGLVVTVTFAGNLEQTLGRGHLETGVVAVILRPSDARFATADLATDGAGPIGRTLSKTHSKAVGVVRNGRKLTFFIAGPGSSNVGRIDVKAFAAAPGSKSARKLAGAEVSPDYWERIEEEIATSESRVELDAANAKKASCPSLRAMYKQALADLARARGRRDELEGLGKKVDAAITEVEKKVGLYVDFAVGFAHTVGAPIGALIGWVSGKAPAEHAQSWRDLLRSLKLDRKLVDAYLDRNQKLIENLLELRGKLAALIAVCQTTQSPPRLKPISAVFDKDTLSTTYTEDASGEGLTYEWSVRIPDDADCARGFKPSSPEQNQATWYHADKSQRLDGPCNHDGKHSGTRGHPGTVTVVVQNRNWKCKATYEGTEGDGGSPEGKGAEPTPCEPR